MRASEGATILDVEPATSGGERFLEVKRTMRTGKLTRKGTSQRGAVLVEFALVAILFFMVLLGIFEMERMLLVYTSLSNAARGGVRYAQVHGSNRTGSGATGPSSSASHQNVVDTVKALTGGSTINAANLNVTVTYKDTTNTPGSRVQVTASYVYDPFTIIPGLGVTLSSTSQGVITF
jgi:Flp pilus assembly protein TadG